MQTIEPYSVLILWRDGAIVAAQRETKTVIRDDAGVVVHERPNPAEPIPLDLGTEILGEVNAGLLARIAELEAALAAALNGSPIETPDLLAALNEAFETHVPEALRAQFEPAWVTVRNLLQAGKIGRAAAFVRALPVPAELEPAREQIATMIDGGA